MADRSTSTSNGRRIDPETIDAYLDALTETDWFQAATAAERAAITGPADMFRALVAATR